MPLWAFFIPLIGVLIGGALAIGGQWLAQRQKESADRKATAAANKRQDESVRAIIVALVKDLYGYVLATEQQCIFDPAKWQPSLSRLLAWADKVEMAQALGPDTTTSLLHAVFQIELLKTNLERYGTRNPLDLAKTNDEEAQRAAEYVGTIRGLVYEPYLSITVVVGALVGVDEIPTMPRHEIEDVLQYLRQRRANATGRRP